MRKLLPLLPIIIAAAGLILMTMDLMGLHINERGSDAIVGAILLGAGVIALQCKGQG